VVCTDLPGRRFHDRGDPKQPGLVREPVYLGIQRGREVVDPVPADRPEATFKAEFRIGRRPGGAPNFLGPYAGWWGPQAAGLVIGNGGGGAVRARSAEGT